MTHINVKDILQMLSQNVVVADVALQCASHSRYLAPAFESLGCEVRRFENNAGQSVGLLVPVEVLGKRLLEFHKDAKCR